MTRTLRDRFIEAARAYEGYTARAGKANDFGARTGYDSVFWAGSFIDVVAREVGLHLPAHVYPASALSHYVQTGRIRRVPRAGDIAFYNSAAHGEPAFGTASVGIVTDVSKWRTAARFSAVDAQTSTGLPRGSQEPNGVYQRTHYSTDVIAFARPRFRETASPTEENTAAPVVRPTQLNGPKPNPKSIELVQSALALKVPLRQAARGKFDGQTRAAYAAWQRFAGYTGPDASGAPDYNSLARLARETGLFQAKP